MKKAKAALRQECIARRRKLPEEVRLAAGEKAAKLLAAQPVLQKGKILSGYWPLHGEFEVRPALLAAAEKGCVLALPVIETAKEPLIFRSYTPGDTLLKDQKHDIYEPLPAQKKVIPNILLVPLVAFDRRGFRLGLGGGYYDRTLQKLKQEGHAFITIGIGYAESEVEKIPEEAHDVKMDYILTETAFGPCGAA